MPQDSIKLFVITSRKFLPTAFLKNHTKATNLHIPLHEKEGLLTIFEANFYVFSKKTRSVRRQILKRFHHIAWVAIYWSLHSLNVAVKNIDLHNLRQTRKIPVNKKQNEKQKNDNKIKQTKKNKKFKNKNSKPRLFWWSLNCFNKVALSSNDHEWRNFANNRWPSNCLSPKDYQKHRTPKQEWVVPLPVTTSHFFEYGDPTPPKPNVESTPNMHYGATHI
jgi:hypothetical protein